MNVVFFAQPGHEFDARFAQDLGEGVAAVGQNAFRVAETDTYRDVPEEPTIAITVGVKGRSRAILEHYSKPPHHAVLIDKGYFRIKGGPLKTLHWRMSVDAFQPHRYLLSRSYSSRRWESLRLPLTPCRARKKGTIIFCGSSQKYCDWHKLGDATVYAKSVLDTLVDVEGVRPKRILYRPKPTWKEAVQIYPYAWSRKTALAEELPHAACVIAHGSNATIEAITRGVPAIVLGEGAASLVASSSLSEINDPIIPSLEDVTTLCSALAWQQWTLDEMKDGLCWRNILDVIRSLEDQRRVDQRKTKP